MQMCVSVSDLHTHAHTHTHARTRTHARTHSRTTSHPEDPLRGWRSESEGCAPAWPSALPCVLVPHCVCVVESFPSECVVAAPPSPWRWSRPCDVLCEERERGDACHILKGALNCLCEPRQRRGGARLSHAPEGTESSQGNLESQK